MSAAHDYPNRVIDPRDETIATLRAQLAAALAGQGRAEKDAARYRWLAGRGGCFDYIECGEWCHEWSDKAELDDAIDTIAHGERE